MEQVPLTPDDQDWFEREEQCRKALRTVRKAVFMRLLVTGILLWVLLQSSMEIWIVGLMAFVLIINLTGLFPLVSEWKKQRIKLKEILAEEE